jgi:hypothetical protein
VQVATTAPQTSSGLLEVGPDMAKILTVVALRKAILSSNMVQAIQFEYLVGL